jgi:Ser/Thr protein kinase RdoA (MazF antagonist)
MKIEYEDVPTTVILQFSVTGTFVKAGRFGHGLINDTYLCEFKEDGALHKYIVQRINSSVFKHPEQVMDNVEAVTMHIANRLREQGIHNPSMVAPVLLPTLNGRLFARDDSGAYWRIFHFIESGAVFNTVRDVHHAYEVGRGLGKFQALLADMEPAKLHDTLPGFHHTPRYLSDYDKALKEDVKQRAADVRTEAAFVSPRRFLAPLLADLRTSGLIPLRVVHNDPKVNNIMIHTATGAALCMLDLDTVMPGIVPVDFGDCVRSAANPAGEDAHDLEAVGIDLSFFEAIASGYLREAGGFLIPTEIKALPLSVKVITFELGLRFLADYLRGDTYFKIKYPAHNLDRARVQFRLLHRIESTEEQMTSLVDRLAPRR